MSWSERLFCSDRDTDTLWPTSAGALPTAETTAEAQISGTIIPFIELDSFKHNKTFERSVLSVFVHCSSLTVLVQVI